MVEMLKNGVLTQGTHNICYAHNDSDILHVIDAYDKTLSILSKILANNSLDHSVNCPPIYPVFQVRQ